MSKKHTPNAQWLAQLRRGAGLTCGGLLLVSLSYALWMRDYRSPALAAAAAGGLLGLVAFHTLRQAVTRARGLLIESQAQKALANRLPPAWKMSTGVPVPGLGDSDVFLESPVGPRFAIEIKSHEGCTVRKTWWKRTRVELRRLDGSKFKSDPLLQARQVATALRATPVVWFPNASKASTATVDGAFVVQGGPRVLLKALGATSTWVPW